jgi:tripartite-type tricarboxylate transporter receptor subunit TctC
MKKKIMKKLVLSCFLSVLSAASMAKETVTFYYTFSPGDTQAHYSRTLIEEANRSQNKYNFILDFKPGAGGSIATNYVKNTPDTILATGSNFFIRPVFFPKESYNVDDFKSLMPQCELTFAVSSSRWKNWKEIPRDAKFNIGISGVGATSHLIGLQLLTQYPNAQLVPFKSTNESLIAMVGKQVDVHIGFLGEVENWMQQNKRSVYVLGLTGKRSINKHPLLINQGFPVVLSQVTAPMQLIVPASVDNEKFNNWRKILVSAGRAKSVQNSYAVDYCISNSDMLDNEIQPWFRGLIEQWKKLSVAAQAEGKQ